MAMGTLKRSVLQTRLEKAGIRCVYTSVNTESGEARNRLLETRAGHRDFLLR